MELGPLGAPAVADVWTEHRSIGRVCLQTWQTTNLPDNCNKLINKKQRTVRLAMANRSEFCNVSRVQKTRTMPQPLPDRQKVWRCDHSFRHSTGIGWTHRQTVGENWQNNITLWYIACWRMIKISKVIYIMFQDKCPLFNLITYKLSKVESIVLIFFCTQHPETPSF